MKKKILLFVSGTILFYSYKSTQTHKVSTGASLQLPAFNKEGHRGTRGLMPENTIPAMYKAIDYDVNTVEVDVVISRDKKVVISHDICFNPDITTTPEGTTMTKKEAEGRLLYNMTYDSIRKYDVGLKPYEDFPQQEKISAHKPLLSELIDVTDAYAKSKGKEVILMIVSYLIFYLQFFPACE